MRNADDNGNGSDMPWAVFIRGGIGGFIWSGAVGAVFGAIFGGGIGGFIWSGAVGGVILGVFFLGAGITYIIFKVFRYL